MTRVVIADDHPLFRNALKLALDACVDSAEVLEAENLEQTRAILGGGVDIDLLLLDLHMPGSNGLTGLVGIRCEYPEVAVVVISANENPGVIRRALDHGAAGFIPKSSGLEVLTEAVTAVLDCRTWVPSHLHRSVAAMEEDGNRDLAGRISLLTPQQFRVLQMVADGQLNKQIADRLGIQERTVKAHMSEIFAKLEVRNRTQAGVAFRRLELVDPTTIRE